MQHEDAAIGDETAEPHRSAGAQDRVVTTRERRAVDHPRRRPRWWPRAPPQSSRTSLSPFSLPLPPPGPSISRKNPAKRRFARALLAARANRQVSARSGGRSAGADRMKILETK